MESVPTTLDKGREETRMVVESVLDTLKKIYGLELNNFESLRLWAYAKEAVEREQSDTVSSDAERKQSGKQPIPRAFNPNSTNPKMEALELFLTREYGVSTEDVHRIYELDMPGGAVWQFKSKPETEHTRDILIDKGHRVGMSKTGKVVKDFKAYLKILQKRSREGTIGKE